MIFRYFAGMSDCENNKKTDDSELDLIFSMTKMITCTAALQLYEQGKYKMSDSLSKYLLEFERMKVSFGVIKTASVRRFLSMLMHRI